MNVHILHVLQRGREGKRREGEREEERRREGRDPQRLVDTPIFQILKNTLMCYT